MNSCKKPQDGGGGGKAGYMRVRSPGPGDDPGGSDWDGSGQQPPPPHQHPRDVTWDDNSNTFAGYDSMLEDTGLGRSPHQYDAGIVIVIVRSWNMKCMCVHVYLSTSCK